MIDPKNKERPLMRMAITPFVLAFLLWVGIVVLIVAARRYL